MPSLSSPTYLITGGCGFIGSNFTLMARQQNWSRIINLDAITYAANPANLSALANDEDYVFVKGSIGDRHLVEQLFEKYKPDGIINFAAESHVDRSILHPDSFINTNILGTHNLLEETLNYWNNIDSSKQKEFRFLHVSTDEVYGSLDANDPPFEETTPYDPRSPYSASKAASDHLVNAYHHTYGLPSLITNCSNNYGPYQFPEKLIPLIILNCLNLKPLPIYGDGQNIRDWLYVEDHCQGIYNVMTNANIGETYNIGGQTERTNIEVVHTICNILDELKPKPDFSYSSLITFVKDRLGHDRRYAINCNKIKKDLNWQAQESFPTGIRKTIQWYLEHPTWIEQVCSGEYQNWIQTNYKKSEGSIN
ncbi:dTDP-glucose 4,6-dehydratase [[Leptolyngbya] sp. PCC 7376]|uniref:dTDP-glucose 4,6-dehydratase n=1 Tax=[Leptolyngbya] sp. PCC 7376 TaxID=111781 RepID=UPI00029F02F4|nr:dTDP-glucose 4,6-dehydratase [[Leptolyngbya] sp. PCC 7376]AFY36955.1 dTDP-glucose 4,6-dehydratase [[Leptolyngbya] sp. PCC 7376]